MLFFTHDFCFLLCQLSKKDNYLKVLKMVSLFFIKKQLSWSLKIHYYLLEDLKFRVSECFMTVQSYHFIVIP